MKSRISLLGGLLIAAALIVGPTTSCRAQAANVPFAGAWQRFSHSAGKTLNIVVSQSGNSYLAVQDYGIHHPGYKVQWTLNREGTQLKGSHVFTVADMQAGGATDRAISQLTGKLVAHLTLTLNPNGTLGQDEDLPHWFTNRATGQITRINPPGVNIVHSIFKQLGKDDSYRLTIYVDGQSLPNGHVFLGLAKGTQVQFYGFHSNNKWVALARLGGGAVRDDSNESWNVRKSFPLTQSDYQNALMAISDWRTQNEAWWLNHHCGDFVQTVAESAGIDINLPWTFTGHNRPGLFADYLLQHGGEPNLTHTAAAASPQSNDASQ